MNNEKKKNRGGWRVGGGRPKIPLSEKKVRIGISLSPDLVRLLKKSQHTPSRVIEELLRAHYETKHEL